MLSFARPEEGELEADFEVLDINKVIEETIYLAEHDSKNVRIEIKKNLSVNMPMIMACAKKLQQAFFNIIINAFAAMEHGGVLTLSSEYNKANKSVVVSFSDTGSGFAPEILDKIFDPFFTSRKGGTGLGLTITHQIISIHKGKIDVQSQPGEGTTFLVSFPIGYTGSKS